MITQPGFTEEDLPGSSVCGAVADIYQVVVVLVTPSLTTTPTPCPLTAPTCPSAGTATHHPSSTSIILLSQHWQQRPRSSVQQHFSAQAGPGPG